MASPKDRAPKPPKFRQPPFGKTVPITYIRPKSPETCQFPVLYIMKEPLAPGYKAGTHGDAHPDTDKYPGYYLDFIQPSEDLQTALWVYIKAQQVIDQKITTEFGGGDLNIIRTRGTKIYSGFSGYSGYSVYQPFQLDEGIPVISSEITDLIEGDMVKETVELAATSPPTLILTNGGSGYTCAPTVGFTGGVGSGATATASVGFPVASVTLSAGGSGYGSAPAVYFVSNDDDGQGATAVTTLGYTIDSLEVLIGGSGYTTAPTVNLTGGGGTGATATSQLGFALASIAVTSQGSNYTAIPTVLLTGGAGAGAFANAVLGYPLTALQLTSGGTGYTSTPTVVITPAAGDGGSGAAATATFTKEVTSVLITNPGTTYASAPSVAFSGGLGAGGIAATGFSVLGFSIASAAVSLSGSGYTSPPTVTITGDGTGATASAFLGLTQASVLANTGASYSVNDVLTLSGGSGTSAQLLVTSVDGGGAITGFSISVVGAYSSVPSSPVTLTGGTGHSATLTAAWNVSACTITAPGSLYTFANANLSGGGGSQAAIKLTLSANGTVKSVTVQTPGSGYTSAPTVVFSGGGGTGAAATASISGVVNTITLTNPGIGYSVPPTISFSGGTGTGAAASVNTLTTSPAVVSYIQLTSLGSGYTSAPTVSIVPDPSDTTGSGAAATASLAATGSVISFTVTNPGTGYTSTPAVGLSGGGGTGASGYSQLASTGSVKTVTLTNPGFGYTSAPSIYFSGGQGSGAVATTTLGTVGIVIEVTLTAPGSYTVAPTVTFSGCSGTGAAAVYNLPSGNNWPELFESHTDEQTGIVVEITKQIVPAGTQFFQSYITPAGALGPIPQFVDINALDKWRSIQITSKIDPHSLPPPYIIGTSMRYDFPDILLDVGVAWGDAVSNDIAYQNTVPTSPYRLPTADAGGTSSCDGDIVVQAILGPKGFMPAEHRQSFFYGPPSAADIPSVFLFQEVEGTASLQATAVKVSTKWGTATGEYSQQFQLQTRSRPLGPFLTRRFFAQYAQFGVVSGKTSQVLNANHQPPAFFSQDVAYLTDGGGDAQDNDGSPLGANQLLATDPSVTKKYTATIGVLGGFGKLFVTLPLSFQGYTTSLGPANLPTQILITAEATRWRFGVWVLDLWYVNIPSNYAAYL